MKVINYICLCLLFLSGQTVAQNNYQNWNVEKLAGTFCENNGYKIVFEKDKLEIFKENNLIFQKGLTGLKTVKFSQNEEFTLIQNYYFTDKSGLSELHSFVFDGEYNIVTTFQDTIYRDYPAKVYNVNNNGNVVILNPGTSVLTVWDNNDINTLDIADGYKYDTETQNFINIDDEYIYVVRNITNPATVETIEQNTWMYKISMDLKEVVKSRFPISVVTCFNVFNNQILISGIQLTNGANANVSLFLNDNLEIINSTDLYKFNKVINYNNYLICLTDNQLVVLENNKVKFGQKYTGTGRFINFCEYENNLFLIVEEGDKINFYPFNTETNLFNLDKEVISLTDLPLFKIIKSNNCFIVGKDVTYKIK